MAIILLYGPQGHIGVYGKNWQPQAGPSRRVGQVLNKNCQVLIKKTGASVSSKPAEMELRPVFLRLVSVHPAPHRSTVKSLKKKLENHPKTIILVRFWPLSFYTDFLVRFRSDFIDFGRFGPFSAAQLFIYTAIHN